MASFISTCLNGTNSGRGKAHHFHRSQATHPLTSPNHKALEHEELSSRNQHQYKFQDLAMRDHQYDQWELTACGKSDQPVTSNDLSITLHAIAEQGCGDGASECATLSSIPLSAILV